ncbi:MAG: hydantoinase/oxoprolinase family protein [Acidobacteria bacterium]|nr:hydantoinase/oxoprolinase family protein [Acidobacteriota bacterium]
MRIGIDAGGTFTDFVVMDRRGRLSVFKLRSNPAAPAQVILQGIERAVREHPGETRVEVVHGSTVATNAVLERKGARTAFVTTAGFEDLLLIGRQNRRELYNLTPVPRAPLVPPELCLGVRERAHHDGTVARTPSARELTALARRLLEAGVESVAVCFLHAYRVSANEKAVAEALAGTFHVSASHEVSPEFREYERGATTAVNAYVAPLMDRYLCELEQACPYPVSILQSNGGVMSAGHARRHAVRTVLSGPAGGAVGAHRVASRSGFRQVLGFDMGGTSTDVCLIDGEPRETVESAIDGLPIRIPMLDIHTVGAGGGSIARVDAGGLLKVGPESAGADPGPACYGRGDDATVTDAHVVLGRIAANQFLGGAMRLDAARAAAAVDGVASRLGLSREAAALGIVRVANANMERAIRAVSVERGHDPRSFALLAFGGCGALHACELAEALGMRTVLVPREAGVLSALGMLLGDTVRDYAAGVLGSDDAAGAFARLEAEARRDLPRGRITRTADARYVGQSYELTVPWSAKSGASAAFHAAHLKTYGYASEHRPVELVTARVRARLAAARGAAAEAGGAVAGYAAATRRVMVNGAWRKVDLLVRGAWKGRRPGPALIADYGATVLVPRGWHCAEDRFGTLVITLRA